MQVKSVLLTVGIGAVAGAARRSLDALKVLDN